MIGAATAAAALLLLQARRRRPVARASTLASAGSPCRAAPGASRPAPQRAGRDPPARPHQVSAPGPRRCRRCASEWPDLRLIALDQRGHGASSDAGPGRVPRGAELASRWRTSPDLLAFMDAEANPQRNPGRPLHGQLRRPGVALTAPDRVDRLVLVATAARGQGDAMIRDYVLDEPVEGGWRKALEAAGKAFPEEVYGLTPRAADPDVEAGSRNSGTSTRWPTRRSSRGSSRRRRTSGWAPGSAPPGRCSRPTTASGCATCGCPRSSSGAGRTRSSPSPTRRIRARPRPRPGGTRHAVGVQDLRRLALPPSGAQESDLGHNLQWEAPEAVAADILAFAETGGPTGDLVRTADPADPRQAGRGARQGGDRHRPAVSRPATPPSSARPACAPPRRRTCRS